MQPRCGSQDNVVQVAFPLPVAEHRIEPQFLENQVALTISAANDAGDRLGNGLRGGLDEFGPMVDPVMHFIQVPIPASRLHGYHGLKIPIILAGKPETLPVGDRPEDGRINGTTEVRMKFGTWGLGRLRHTRFYFSVLGRWGEGCTLCFTSMRARR